MRRWTISSHRVYGWSRCSVMLPILCIIMSCGETPQSESQQAAIPDEYVRLTDALNPDRTPPEPDPASYGMDPATGRFIYPKATPEQHDDKPFEGQLDYWDTNEYTHNMTVEAYYPILVEPFHTWQNIVDFDGRRYMYQYVRGDVKIYDITNPKDLKVLLEKGSVWTGEGAKEVIDPYPEGEMFGAASIQWNKELEKYIMVQAYEIRRFGLLHDKRTEPENVEQIRHANHLKGFKV